MLIKKINIIVFLVFLSSFLVAQTAESSNPTNPGDEGQGFEATLIDFNQTGEQNKEDYLFQNDNWLVELNSSSDFVANRQLSFTKNVKDKGQNNHLGVRVNFPEYPHNGYALIKPPRNFIFEALTPEDSIGVVKNVKELRKIIVKIAGRYFPHKLLVILQDINGKKTTYNLGNLYFYGWEEVEWENKNILRDIRRSNFSVPPVYPRILPSIRLDSIEFFRNGEDEGGDFITYVSWIKVVYNKANAFEIVEDDTNDEDYINDEAVWRINESRYNNISEDYSKLFENFKQLRRIKRSSVNAGNETENSPAETTTQPNTEEIN